jgi:alkanesulfonate monooxygenase SsuD/methylene tetrahydromethanopterin reductase-like flavin-dependent oxidoreductase (luciferase family)
MQIGAVYPQIELRGDPVAVRTFGTAVEDLGFDHLLAYDHVVGAVHADRARPLTGPYTEHDPFHDPLVMFAYLAGITTRLQFTTGVLILPQRQTVLVARQAADVDLFSGGRLRLGVGVGWNDVEYEALGQDFRTRGARQEEQIGLLRRLFTEPVVDFTGRFDRVDRAARLADGFVFSRGDVEEAVETWKRIRDRVEGYGRSVADFGVEVVVRVQDSVEELTDRVGVWREAGGTHLSVVTMGRGLDSVEAHLDHLSAVSKALDLPGRV